VIIGNNARVDSSRRSRCDFSDTPRRPDLTAVLDGPARNPVSYLTRANSHGYVSFNLSTFGPWVGNGDELGGDVIISRWITGAHGEVLLHENFVHPHAPSTVSSLVWRFFFHAEFHDPLSGRSDLYGVPQGALGSKQGIV